jgi:hypothetical protein
MLHRVPARDSIDSTAGRRIARPVRSAVPLHKVSLPLRARRIPLKRPNRFDLSLVARSIPCRRVVAHLAADLPLRSEFSPKFMPDDECILLIEDTAEIQLSHANLVRFEARQEQNGVRPVLILDLLKASLRHRPDRILLGELRGGEAFELLQLLNTGRSRTLCTIHANSARQGRPRTSALRLFCSCKRAEERIARAFLCGATRWISRIP